MWKTRSGTSSPARADRTRLFCGGLQRARWLFVMGVVVCCSKAKVVDPFPTSFGGVGLELRIEGDTPIVIRALPGGAADEAGLQPGDPIIAIDGISTKGLHLGDVIMRLRGQPETQVSLTVQRKQQRVTVVMLRRNMTKTDADYRASP